jgi:hypothetical protein
MDMIKFPGHARMVSGWILFFILVPFFLNPVTWNPKKKTCPLCHRDSQYYVLGSYGGYVHYRDSRFELVEFPHDEELALYTCIYCGYSVFMEDFSTKLKRKIQKKLRTVLADFRFPRKVENYARISISERLELAEYCYAAGVSCDCAPFWIWFYPIKAYYVAKADKAEEARNIRIKTLGLVESALLRPENQGIQKELVMDAGILKYLTGDKEGALMLLNDALSMIYHNKELSTENNDKYNRYLAEFIGEYLQKISKKSP